MKTTIEVTNHRIHISTEGFGFNTLNRHNMPELWQWHEAVANAIANHHASAMGEMLPCPEPEVALTQRGPRGEGFGQYLTYFTCKERCTDHYQDDQNRIWCPRCKELYEQIQRDGEESEPDELGALNNQINQLEEFLFDDYGDTVAQLGIEKVRELEAELKELKTKRAALVAQSAEE